MFAGSTVFAQLLEYLPRRDFHNCVARYGGDHRLRNFSCRDQFLTLAFAQLTFRESLRDIETCLRALGLKLTIAKLYRSRWQVELFFKCIKQNLRIKAFSGTTENAMKTQIWVAISIDVLVAIVG